MSKWPMVKLGDILQPAPKILAGEIKAPILSITMHNGLVEQNGRFKKRIASTDTSTYRIVKRGQLVVGFPIDEGVLDFQEKYDTALVSPAYGIWNLVNNDVLPDFMGRYLRSPHAIATYKSRLQGTSARRRSLPTKAFQDIEILLPPLGEQKRIAEILNKATLAINIAQQNIQNILNFKKAYQNSIINACITDSTELSQIASIQSGITKGRKTKEDTPLKSVPYMAVSNVKAGRLDLSTVKKIDASEAEIDRYLLKTGDILLTEGGDPDKLGRGSIWRNEIQEAIHQNHIFRVRINPTSNFTPEALMAILESKESKYYFLRSAKQTTGISSINKTQLSATPIPVLDQAQVNEITRLWHDSEQIIALYRQKLALLQELQRSLSARAFAGEL